MATDILMPQMGESIAEGTITRWLKNVGDTVKRDEPLLEISTDKVDAEIPAPASGVLLERRYEEGATVGVNRVIGTIGAEGEGSAEAPSPAPAAAAATPTAAAAPAAPEAPKAAAGSLEERLRTHSSPVVRKIAAEHGVDITQLDGSGIHGRVTKKDILAHLESGAKPAAPAVAAAPAAVAPPATGGFVATAAAAPAAAVEGYSVPAYLPGERIEIEPMSKIRQITAAHMRYSKSTSAHVTTLFEFDLTRITKLRAKAKDRFFQQYGTKLTYMPFIFKAVASALRKYPKVNAAIDGTNIVYKKDINIAMAVALDWGLIVPVIKNADQLSLAGLAAAANDLADRARAKKLSPDEVKGGTFTITNPGVFGSLFGTPVINQPQVAILGVGAIEKRPKVITDAEGNDVIAIRSMAYFAITYDHRLVDGADADHFMNHIKAMLENGDWSEVAASV